MSILFWVLAEEDGSGGGTELDDYRSEKRGEGAG